MPQFSGPTDPAADARWPDAKPRKGFFTDTSICIGCKACEVACKEWNHNPRDGDLDLLGVTLDPNVQIQESKVGSCDIRAGRRPQGEQLLHLVADYQSRSGATTETDNERITDPGREIVNRAPGPDQRKREG